MFSPSSGLENIYLKRMLYSRRRLECVLKQSSGVFIAKPIIIALFRNARHLFKNLVSTFLVFILKIFLVFLGWFLCVAAASRRVPFWRHEMTMIQRKETTFRCLLYFIPYMAAHLIPFQPGLLMSHIQGF